jgi:hypothetical protein
VENVRRLPLTNVNYGTTVKSDLQMAILRRFRAAGIKIPVVPHDEPVPRAFSGEVGPGSP